MPEKKVLIITYYWPPSGGSGVQRWLKFVKYLPQLGYKPYVFTPKNPSFAVKDESLQSDVPKEVEVIHFPIWEPYEAFFTISKVFSSKQSRNATAVVSGTKKSFFQKLSVWVRGNFFIPDPRIFWVKPAVKFLDEYLRKHAIETIITTGPPHSMHLIGLKLKQKNPSLKWFADFRDPWSEWGFLDSLMVGTRARKLHQKLEAKVLRTADKIITITPFYVRQFEELAQRNVHLLTNGFDEDDFKNLILQQTDKFVIRHVGIINEKCDPRPFMLALKEVMEENESFRNAVQLDFVGEVHPQFKAFVESDLTLAAITIFTSTIPHKQLISLYGSSSVLLLVLTGYKDAQGYMPGKLFEYFATGLPVLGIGPEQGDAEFVIDKSGSGKMIDGKNSEVIKKFLIDKFHRWSTGSQDRLQRSEASVFSRKEITKKLVELLDDKL